MKDHVSDFGCDSYSLDVSNDISSYIVRKLANVTTLSSSTLDCIRAAYARDDLCLALICARGSYEFKYLYIGTLAKEPPSIKSCCTIVHIQLTNRAL